MLKHFSTKTPKVSYGISFVLFRRFGDPNRRQGDSVCTCGRFPNNQGELALRYSPSQLEHVQLVQTMLCTVALETSLRGPKSSTVRIKLAAKQNKDSRTEKQNISRPSLKGDHSTSRARSSRCCGQALGL